MPRIAENPATPRSLLIRGYYRKLGLNKKWTKSKVLSFCKLLHITVSELASLFDIPDQRMARWLKNDEFPPWVCIHFSTLESWFVQVSLGVEQEPIIPIHILTRHD